jgi:glycerol-3-phosphate dehydrogenase
MRVPDEHVIDPWTTPIAFATEAVANGCTLFTGVPITGARVGEDVTTLVTADGREVTTRFVVNAAGLHGDELHRAFGFDGFTVTPRRGELIVFDKLARGLVEHILLPVPTERTKGVLISPTVYGNVLLGPTADDLEDRRDRSTTADGIAGLLADGARIVPGLAGYEVTATFAGLRAATEHRDYQLRVHPEQRYACAGGIRSTGVSGSLGIAEHVREGLESAGLELAKDPAPSTVRMPNIGEATPRPYRDRPGSIVCFCERVTRGEIDAALDGPIPPIDADGLRRRTRAVMGRCQGFFCGAEIERALSRDRRG